MMSACTTACLSFSVDGVLPVNWNSNEWAWRAAIAAAARKQAESKITVDPSTHYTVALDFRLPPLQAARADLDNLAKPVLDTLFTVRYPQVKVLQLTGALFDVDDDRVFNLRVTKQQVSDAAQAGVSVNLSWS
jgi:Holliday junction resolvase RusA-like endonuclease